MPDDTGYNNRVVQAQEQGRSVNCSTAGAGTREEIAKRYAAQMVGYRFVEESVL